MISNIDVGRSQVFSAELAIAQGGGEDCSKDFPHRLVNSRVQSAINSGIFCLLKRLYIRPASKPGKRINQQMGLTQTVDRVGVCFTSALKLATELHLITIHLSKIA